METRIEERLAVLFDSAKGRCDLPRGVFNRLLFLARVLHLAPIGRPGQVRLLWLDARGELALAEVGPAGVIVGREASCDIVLPSLRVSRRHCAVHRVGTALADVEIEELGSSNGTRINGLPLAERGKSVLRDGDVIEVGGVPLALAMGETKS